MRVRKSAKNITLDRKIGMLVGASWRDGSAVMGPEYSLAQVSMPTMLSMRNEPIQKPCSAMPLYIAWDGEDKLLLFPAAANGGELRITAYGTLMEL